MQVKDHYEKYDFIKKSENVYVNISKGNDGLIPHSHDFYELVIITSGHGTHIINDIAYIVIPGDIFLMLPSDVHSFVPIDGDNKFNWISCIWLSEFYEIGNKSILATKKFSDEYTYDIYNQILDMHSEFYAKKEDYLSVIKLILEVVIFKLIRISEKANDDYGLMHKKKLVKKAVNFINENYSKDIDLSDVSNHLMISQVYLCKLFKSQMQLGAMQYLHKIRIDKAMQLISATDMKIDEISAAVGFTDVKSLYSLFKKHTGVSPGSFRKHYYL